MPTLTLEASNACSFLAYSRSGSAGSPFSEVRNNSPGKIANSGTSFYTDTGLTAGSTLDSFWMIHRGLLVFDTSALPAGATILSAAVQVLVSGIKSGLGTPKTLLTGCTIANPTTPSDSDYNKFLDSPLSDTKTISANSAYTYTLNEAGLAYINKGGHTAFMSRTTWDVADLFDGVWANGAESTITTSHAMKYMVLTIEWAEGGGPVDVELAGIAGGSSAVSGDLPVEWNLSSAIAASSTCSGDVSSGYAVDLAGTVSAVTICSGTAIRDLSLTCTVSTRAVQVSGSLARAIPVSGNISVASNFYAVFDQHSSFYGLVTANSTIAGRLTVRSVRTAEACADRAIAVLIRQVKGDRGIEARVGRLSGTTLVVRARALTVTGYLREVTGTATVFIIILEYKRFLVIEIDLDFVTMELDLDFKVVELRS